ncbi:protein of unknown function [Shewanella benthica]|uniref:Uncharacterized protein n=1 Tax=Shewanella benthica TaxID=43661 RepID=A0A330M9R9_9GAMM|nr:protein of unknown function [Shewanella benthica]
MLTREQIKQYQEQGFVVLNEIIEPSMLIFSTRPSKSNVSSKRRHLTPRAS